jgi:hypothetical protein
MIQTRYRILNWLVVSTVLYFACGLQTSFWHQLTDGAPAPQFWLIIILYLTLYRTYFQAMFGTYALAFIIKSFSAVSLGFIFPLLFLLVSPTFYVKGRIFWPSTRYFVAITAGFTFFYHLLVIFLSYYLDANPAPVQFFTRAVEISLTTLWAAPVYWLMNLIDQITLPEILETEGARE